MPFWYRSHATSPHPGAGRSHSGKGDPPKAGAVAVADAGWPGEALPPALTPARLPYGALRAH